MHPCSCARRPRCRWQRLFTTPLACIVLVLLLLCPGLARAQSWQSNFTTVGNTTFYPSISILLTDGTVICQDYATPNWWKLKPDAFGSYANGTWSKIASMPTGYAPLYYASAVLADGRVVVLGGEYNFDKFFNYTLDTNLGAIYDPVKDTWTKLTGPGWDYIGDAACTVLPNGSLLLQNLFGSDGAVMDPTTLTWTKLSFHKKADPNSEEGWTLLPNGTILTVDCQNGKHAEYYDPATDTWSSAGETVVALTDGLDGYVPEIGPQVLRPDGTVVVFGATGHTSIYDPNKNSWTPGPDFPKGLDIADGPACLLPNGNVFCVASPGFYDVGASFFEFDGTNLISEPETNYYSDVISSYFCHMLMLPTGQVMFSYTAGEVELYTSSGDPDPSWRPTITECPIGVTRGGSYLISGTQFNGLSEASVYGDDYSTATNFPLVRITNRTTGHVIYFRTHDHSTMGVATGAAIVSTHFDVPADTELGVADLVVVTNGIASDSIPITVALPPTANAASVSVPFNTPTAITLTGSDPNAPALSLTYAIGTSPTHGKLSGLNATTGAVTYTPNAGFHGTDSFTFTVTNSAGLASSTATVTLTVPIGTPTANPQEVSVNQDTAIAITLTGSDPNAPALSLTYAIGTSPTHGKLSGLNATTGAVTYTPNAGFHGTDSFTFTVNNGTNTSAQATVTITVQQTLFDVSGQISISQGAIRLERATGHYVQTLTLTNTGNTTVNGPISVILDSLQNATLYNATGTTVTLLPAGRPYINASVTSLAPGESTKVTLIFTKSGTGNISYSTQVVAGPGSR